MNKKSNPSDKIVNGNVNKYYSYREAMTRIKLAIENGYYFEAITIEESILCDRLLSYLIGTQNFPMKEDENIFRGSKTNLGNLLNLLKKSHPKPINIKNYLDMHEAIDNWRKKRNECIHSIVKSFPGKPTINIDDFLFLAKETSIEGKNLCKVIQQLK